MWKKIKLKYLYFKTLFYQYKNHKGCFPFAYYFKLSDYIKKYDVKNVLEIGTGLGLTSIAMSLSKKDIKIDSIDLKIEHLNIAKENLKKYFKKENQKKNLEKKINFIFGKYYDLFKDEIAWNKERFLNYDLIFYDAFVSRILEIKFFKEMTKSGTILIISNINEKILKSKEAKEYLLDKNNFDLLEIKNDTIFVRNK